MDYNSKHRKSQVGTWLNKFLNYSNMCVCVCVCVCVWERERERERDII